METKRNSKHNLKKLHSAVQDIQISQKLLIECPSKDNSK